MSFISWFKDFALSQMAAIEKRRKKDLLDSQLPFYKQKIFIRYFVILPIIVALVVILIIIAASVYWLIVNYGGIV